MQAPLEDLAAKKDELAGAIGFMVSLPFVLFTTKAVGYTVLGAIFLIGIFIAFEPDFSAMSAWIASGLAFGKKARAQRAVSKYSDDEDWDEIAENEEKPEESEEEADGEDDEETELNIIRPTFAKQIAKDK